VIRVVLVIPQPPPLPSPLVREVTWPAVPRVGEILHVGVGSYQEGSGHRAFKVEAVEWFEDVAYKQSPVGAWGTVGPGVSAQVTLSDGKTELHHSATVPPPPVPMHPCPVCSTPVFTGNSLQMCPECIDERPKDGP
jgi:hypothetical protein